MNGARIVFLKLGWCALGVVVFLAQGCAAMTTVRADGSVVRHHFGYVRVIVPAHASTNGDFSVMEISTLGVRLYPSAGLGYFHERNEYIPLDSRLVIRVRNKQQMDQLLKTLTPIVKDGLCITVDSK